MLAIEDRPAWRFRRIVAVRFSGAGSLLTGARNIGMGRRNFLNPDDRQRLFDVPSDEESIMRHYTLSTEDRLEALVRRRFQNQLGFAVQLCLLRYPGRLLLAGEAPPTKMLAYVADQLGLKPESFSLYARRDETRLEHARYLVRYLGVRLMTREDRRAGLVLATEAAAVTDKGEPIVRALNDAFRRRRVVLPPMKEVERIGVAGRAIARRRAAAALLDGLKAEQLEAVDQLLVTDPEQTRFAWLRSAPEAPGSENLKGLLDRLIFIRSLQLEPGRQERVQPERFKQLAREGEVSPSWLIADFNPLRRRATIVAQLLELGMTLTDAAVIMYIKLIGQLFSHAKAVGEQRHLDRHKETAQALRLFRDTLRALRSAKESGGDPFEALDAAIGWDRLVEAQPAVCRLAFWRETSDSMFSLSY